MQIQTKCPECGKIYDIDDEYVGAAVECEKCGTQISVIRLKAQGKTEGEIMMSWRDCFLSWEATGSDMVTTVNYHSSGSL